MTDPTPSPVEPTYPPCPHCRAEVTSVVQHRMHRGGAWLVLEPCGHSTTQNSYPGGGVPGR